MQKRSAGAQSRSSGWSRFLIKVLLTGAGGQHGQALIAPAPKGLELVATSRQELDLADPEACRSAVQQCLSDWLLNAGDYTAVDNRGGECRCTGSLGRPYQPEQARDPLGVYGASKSAGEAAVQSIFGTDGRWLPLAKACWRTLQISGDR